METVTAEPDLITIDEEALLGMPVDEAAALLEDEGFEVDTEEAASNEPAGTVIQVIPTGELPAGSAVHLRYSVSPPPAPTTQAPRSRTPRRPRHRLRRRRPPLRTTAGRNSLPAPVARRSSHHAAGPDPRGRSQP